MTYYTLTNGKINANQLYLSLVGYSYCSYHLYKLPTVLCHVQLLKPVQHFILYIMNS